MSRRSELPEDLERLGLYLEVAAGEAVRRRAAPPGVMNFVGAVTLAVPFALAVAAADLSPGDAFTAAAGADLARRRSRRPTASWFATSPTSRCRAPAQEPCLDAQDCRTPAVPTSLQPARRGSD